MDSFGLVVRLVWFVHQHRQYQPDKPKKRFFGGGGLSSVRLAADNQKVAWSNGRARKAILRFEGFERDTKPLRYFT